MMRLLSCASRTTSKPPTARATGVRPQQRGEDAHRGGLTGAVRAEQSENAALGDREIEPVEGSYFALARAIDLDQAFGNDGVRNGRDLRCGSLHHFMFGEGALRRMTQSEPSRVPRSQRLIARRARRRR